jgi:hypothetical protein
MHTTRTLPVAGILLLFAAAGQAQTPAFSRTDYPTSDAPRGIATADFNRDGALDLALVNTGRQSVTVLMNETTQGRGFVQRYEVVLGGGPFEVAAADLNRDAVIDMVVANADLNTIDIVFGRQAGGFDAPQHVAAAGYPRGVAVTDLDWDGAPDIIYSQFYLDSVQILHGDGAGNFTARVPAIATGPRPQGVVIGEFGGCCRPDIAVANTAARYITILRQNDPVTFQRIDVVSSAGLNVLTAADFDRNGRQDIAGVSTASNKMVLFRDTGSGLAMYGTFGTGASPRGIEAVDLNGDGRLDLVVANRNASNLSVYMALAGSDGWFVAPFTVPAGSGARDVVAADFNLDGHQDLATANEYADSASLLTNAVSASAGPFWEARALQHSTFYTPFVDVADFNGNAAVDVLRADGVLLDGETLVPLTSGRTAQRSMNAGGAGDFNADGRRDVVLLTTYYDGSYPYPTTADLYYGDGAGHFQFAGSFGSMDYVFDARVADVNRDGRSDLVVGTANFNAPGGRIEVLIATDTGLIQQPAVSLSSQPQSLDVGDLDRNGTADLAIANSYDGYGVQLYPGDGAGGFSAGQFLPSTARTSVALADLNRDGILDVVSGGEQALIVWLGSAAGTFTSRQSAANSSYGFTVADLTGDGRLDVITRENELLRGKGDGTFETPTPVDIWFDDAVPVDYDRDGRMDIVLVNYWHTMVVFSRAARGPNLAPVAIAGPDYTRSYLRQFDDECEGGRGPSFDPNLDPLTFEWLDQNGRIVSTAETLCPGILNPGTHTYTLVVRDGHGGESSDGQTITITPFKETVSIVAPHGDRHGSWQWIADNTAAGGSRLWHPDAGAGKLNTALASPTHYFDVWVLADPTQPYTLWVRLKAQNDSWANDSIFVQFEGGALSGGKTRYAMGTTDALAINLEECSGCGVSGWGWRDERWGSMLNGAPALLRFPEGGWRRLRVQTREDGVSIDQIVLSSERYLTAPPGPAKRDTTILEGSPW